MSRKQIAKMKEIENNDLTFYKKRYEMKFAKFGMIAACAMFALSAHANDPVEGSADKKPEASEPHAKKPAKSAKAKKKEDKPAEQKADAPPAEEPHK